MNADLVLAELTAVLNSRLPKAGGNPDDSYVAKLYAKELVMAAKDENRQSIINETADLWFHSLVALTYYGVDPSEVFAELAKRQGVSGLVEKASRPQP